MLSNTMNKRMLVIRVIMLCMFLKSDATLIVKRQSNGCDGDYLQLQCPEDTKIKLLNVFYGRSLPSKDRCPPTNKLPREFTVDDGFTCSDRNAKNSVEHFCGGEQNCSIITPLSLSMLSICPDIR